MNFEQLQQAWQHQPVPNAVDPAALIKKVKTDAAAFDRTIRLRDYREIAAALFIAVVFGLTSLRHGWSHGFAAMIALGVGIFLLIDRRRQRRWASVFDESLLGQLDRAIRLTGHQIWLLKNVFWWYLLPLCVSMLCIRLEHYWALPWGDMLQKAGPRILFDWFLAGGVYWLNQRAVNTKLQPRLNELSELRAQLLDAPTHE